MRWPLPKDAPSREQVSAALNIAKRLESAGYPTYLIGGAVRDSLLGIPTLDVDMCTACPADRIVQLVPKARPWGFSRYSIFRVPTRLGHIEIARFREELGFDGRHCAVRLTDSFERDVFRRDFTVNAIAVEPEGLKIVDLVGGIVDISSRIIRSIGDPSRRYVEDRLRMLRAVRFAAKLYFEISKDDIFNIKNEAINVKSLSAARIRGEIGSILTGPHPGRGLFLLADCGLWPHIFPMLADEPMSAGWARKIASLERASRAKIAEEGMWALAFLPAGRPTSADMLAVADVVGKLKFSKRLAKRIISLCNGIRDSYAFADLPDDRAIALADSPDLELIQNLVYLRDPNCDFETALARRFPAFGQSRFLSGFALGEVLKKMDGEEAKRALLALRIEELSGNIRSADEARLFLLSSRK